MGDDLQKSAENDLKRRYDQKVKAAITKKTNASSKAVEKAKTYTDINWKKHVTENSLDKLYISQLNLYLMEELNMSKSECDKKVIPKRTRSKTSKRTFIQRKETQPHLDRLSFPWNLVVYQLLQVVDTFKFLLGVEVSKIFQACEHRHLRTLAPLTII